MKEKCKLRNGATEYDITVVVTLTAISFLKNGNADQLKALHYLIGLSKGVKSEEDLGALEILKSVGLVSNEGSLYDVTKNLVDSAVVVGDQGNIFIQSPILEILGDSQQSDI